jgi:hypothetical protein
MLKRFQYQFWELRLEIEEEETMYALEDLEEYSVL